jgi:hypothetical protein
VVVSLHDQREPLDAYCGRLSGQGGQHPRGEPLALPGVRYDDCQLSRVRAGLPDVPGDANDLAVVNGHDRLTDLVINIEKSVGSRLLGPRDRTHEAPVQRFRGQPIEEAPEEFPVRRLQLCQPNPASPCFLNRDHFNTARPCGAISPIRRLQPWFRDGPTASVSGASEPEPAQRSELELYEAVGLALVQLSH